MWTKSFWVATAERAIKTAANALLVILGGGVGLLDVPWGDALLGVLAMVIISGATSVASLGAGPVNSPSLVAETTPGRHEKN